MTLSSRTLRGGAIAAALSTASILHAEPATETSTQEALTSKAKALVAVLNGAPKAASQHPSALDVLLGKGRDATASPAASGGEARVQPRTGESRASINKLLSTPGCANHVAAAGQQLLRFARTVHEGVLSNPQAAGFIQAQKDLGIDVEALLRVAGAQLARLGPASSSVDADINAEVARCLQASEVSKHALRLVDALPVSLGGHRGSAALTNSLDELRRVASWAERP